MGEMKWYVLRTAGGKEKKAAEYLQKEVELGGLQDKVAQILVPVKKEIITKNGKRKAVERLLYPGYVLINADIDAYSPLPNIIRNNVPGMSGFLTESKVVSKRTRNEQGVLEESKTLERLPVPIRDEEAQRILGIQDENVDSAAETQVNFEVGDAVKITDGPFSGFNGTVEEILEDRSKLKVIVVIFGRKSILELSFTQVTKE